MNKYIERKAFPVRNESERRFHVEEQREETMMVPVYAAAGVGKDFRGKVTGGCRKIKVLNLEECEIQRVWNMVHLVDKPKVPRSIKMAGERVAPPGYRQRET